MPKTILLADDSVTIQKVVGISFANEDVVLLTVDNGDDAVARARESSPDIVLADIMMPGKNGYEVCEALKSDLESQHIPVLLLSGTFESFDEDRARQVGADGHITKPFEAQALVDQVNELLARSAARSSAPATPLPGDPEDATLVAPLAAEPTAANIDESYDFFDDEMPAMPAPPAPEPQVEAAPEPAEAPAPLADPHVIETEAVAEPEDGETSIYDLEPLEEFASAPQPASAELPGDSFGSSLPGGMNWDTTGDVPMPNRPALSFDESELVSPSTPESAVPEVESSASFGAGAGPEADSGLRGSTEDEADPVVEPVAPAPADLVESSAEEGDPFGGMDLPVGAHIYEPPDLLGDSLLGDSLLGDSAQATPRLDEPTTHEPVACDSVAPEPVAHEPAPVTLPEAEPPAVAATDDPAAGDEMSPEDSWAPLQATTAAPEPVADRASAADSFGAAPEGPMAPAADALPAIDEPSAAEEVSARDDLAAESEPQWGAVPEPGEASAPAQAPAASSPGALSPELEKRFHDTIEKLAWDALGDLSEQMVKEAVNRIEAVAWEVIPQMAETLIREEIQRLKGDED